LPYNGSGTYVLPVTSLTPNATADTTIVSNDFDIFTNDIETALTACITAEGDKAASGDLPMGGNIHTGVGDATALDEYASANQLVDNTLTYGTSATGNDTYLVNDLVINPVAYANGNRFQFIPDAGNTGACTVDFMSIGVKNIKMANGDDPIDGAIQADVPCDVMYDGTSFILMNPYPTYLGAAAGTLVSSSALLAPGSEGDILKITSGVPAWTSGSWTYLDTFNTTGTDILGENTSVPSGTTQIKLLFDGVSGSSTGSVYVDLGISGPTYSQVTLGEAKDNTASSFSWSTNTLRIDGGLSASSSMIGEANLTKFNGSNKFIFRSIISDGPDSEMYMSCGKATLSGAVTAIRVKLGGGTFDAGTVDVFTRI